MRWDILFWLGLNPQLEDYINVGSRNAEEPARDGGESREHPYQNYL